MSRNYQNPCNGLELYAQPSTLSCQKKKDHRYIFHVTFCTPSYIIFGISAEIHTIVLILNNELIGQELLIQTNINMRIHHRIGIDSTQKEL